LLAFCFVPLIVTRVEKYERFTSSGEETSQTAQLLSSEVLKLLRWLQIMLKVEEFNVRPVVGDDEKYWLRGEAFSKQIWWAHNEFSQTTSSLSGRKQATRKLKQFH
jgi:hypothetical protein